MEKKSRSKSKKKEDRINKEKFKIDMDFEKVIDSLKKENTMLRGIASSLEDLEKDLGKSRKKQ